jgi:hypothetical protein
MYQFIPEILEFKNVEGRLMILYDLEERLAISVASNWFEKGIDNFAVLTGDVFKLRSLDNFAGASTLLPEFAGGLAALAKHDPGLIQIGESSSLPLPVDDILSTRDSPR